MLQKTLLMIPGPTPVPDDVLRALARPMINHRGPEYAALQRGLIAGLQQAFRTAGDVQIFPASGTGGLEAAVVNTLSPGDRVLAVPVGSFGERFAEIAAAFGADVARLDVPWGRAAEPAAVAAALAAEPDARALLLTHNETSTGVLNDVPGIVRAARAVRPEVLVLVDAISGMLAAELRTDEWELDVVVAGSQKAWMIPPGLTFLSISGRAWKAHRAARMPRFYFDFSRMKATMASGQTPYTPALPQLFALEVALQRVLGEGLDAGVRRHERLGRAARAAVQAMGLELFAEEGRYSNSLTAVRVPPGVDGRRLRALARERHGVVLAGGQGAYKDSLFRIGHLGWVDQNDLLAALGALELVLRELGLPVEPGHGVGAAQRVFAEAP